MEAQVQQIAAVCPQAARADIERALRVARGDVNVAAGFVFEWAAAGGRAPGGGGGGGGASPARPPQNGREQRQRGQHDDHRHHHHHHHQGHGGDARGADDPADRRVDAVDEPLAPWPSRESPPVANGRGLDPPTDAAVDAAAAGAGARDGARAGAQQQEVVVLDDDSDGDGGNAGAAVVGGDAAGAQAAGAPAPVAPPSPWPPHGRGGVRLGRWVVRATSTTKGRGYLRAGDPVTLRFPDPPPQAGAGAKASKGAGKGKGKGKGKGGALPRKRMEIIRFANRGGYEVGRLPGDARPLIALHDAGHVAVRATALECTEPLEIMATITLVIEVSGTPKLFREAAACSAATAGPSGGVFGGGGAGAGAMPSASSSINVQKAPITRVLELCGLRPSAKADFTPEAFEAQRKRALDAAAAASPLPPPKRASPQHPALPAPADVAGGDALEEAHAREARADAEIQHAAMASLSRSKELEGRALPRAEQPADMCSPLRGYQLQALHFMLGREQGEECADKLHPSWEEYTVGDDVGTGGGGPTRFYHNVFTGECSLEFQSATRATRGGILADSMGLGKTVETIALLVAARPPPAKERREALAAELARPQAAAAPAAIKSPLNSMFAKAADASGAARPKPAQVRFGGTLVVCPMSLLGQWRDEIERHVRGGALRVVVYYGSDRNTKGAGVRALIDADVVLTTFGVLGSELKGGVGGGSDGGAQPGEAPASDGAAAWPPPRSGPLLHVRWWRVVLDEAHSIKGRGTVSQRAACALAAERRWCLTGTPIQNSLEDLYSLLKFLRVEPWCHWGWWSRLIQAPNEAGDTRALHLLRGLLVPLALRRTKDTLGADGAPILSLPPADVQLLELEPTPEERDFYQALYKRSKTEFDTFVEQGRVLHEYAHVLELLLRLRQCCNHPFLVMSRADTANALGKVAKAFMGNKSKHVPPPPPNVPAQERRERQAEERPQRPEPSRGQGQDDASANGRRRSGGGGAARAPTPGTRRSTRRTSTGRYATRASLDADGGDAAASQGDEHRDVSQAERGAGAGSDRDSDKANDRDSDFDVRVEESDGASEGDGSGGSDSDFVPGGGAKGKGSNKNRRGSSGGGTSRGGAARGASAPGSADGEEGACAGPTSAYAVEVVKEIQAALAEGKPYDCPICMDTADDPVITPCAHVTCRECLLQYWASQRGTGGARPKGGSCPTCRAEVASSELMAAPTGSRFRVDIEGQWRSSAKVTALFEELSTLGSEKAVVFSQWTSFLDLLEVAFRRDERAPRGVRLARLDGGVVQARREALLRDFAEADGPNVLLISLKAGGTGLNLTSATRCYLMDPWWNPAVEDQAIHRLHRVGQTRPVRVRRLVVRDSVERRMLDVQARKGAIVDGALNAAARDGDRDARARRIEELKSLFR